MFRHTKLEHKFVHYIPEQLEPGVIYISMDYATAAHSCCCGCGEQVITPFTPTDWKLTFDGETISLWPSIGNWNFHCKSHYIVRRSQVLEAEPWDEKKKKQKHEDEGIRHEERTGMSPHSKLDDNILGLWDRIKKKGRRH
jgi:hypothetical protein